MKYTCLMILLFLAGCTDATLSQFSSIGSSADIECFSGGKLIYKGRSTGKVAGEAQSDGWFFRDEKIGKLIRVSGDCVIVN
jgi:hypothetical protein